ncbi:MAG TPA: hypothetical protein VME68_13595 [Acidobacteriaceae bacterium]|nr:hypothetical protein [Acidobacteriaceae bacterium]
MTEPGKQEKPAKISNREEPAEQENVRPPLQEHIRARTMRPHKGDVGRPGTNEEIFQGSKEKEIR